MRILPRHFGLSFLGFYVATLIVSLAVISIVELMLNFDHLVEHRGGPAGMASYLFLRLPSYYLPYLLPVAAFAASFLSLGLPARALEVLAAKACGVAPLRLVLPVLAAATLLSGASLVLNESLVLEAGRRFESAEGAAQTERRLFQSKGSFWYRRGHTIVRVHSADRENRVLHGVQLYERDRNGRLRRSVQAERAQIADDHRWQLQDAVIRHFDPERPELAPRLEQHAQAWLEVGSIDDLALLDADPRSLPLPRLGRYLDALEREGRPTAEVRALWHARAAEPLSVLLFAWLGAPLGLAVERTRSLASAALRGAVWLALFYALQAAPSLLAAKPTGLLAGAPWLLLLAFGGWGAWSWRAVAR